MTLALLFNQAIFGLEIPIGRTITSAFDTRTATIAEDIRTVVIPFSKGKTT